MSEVDTHVGARIRQRRLVNGVSIERLAALADLDPVNLAACEAGERRVSALELMAICETLHMRPVDIFRGYPANDTGRS